MKLIHVLAGIGLSIAAVSIAAPADAQQGRHTNGSSHSMSRGVHANSHGNAGHAGRMGAGARDGHGGGNYHGHSGGRGHYGSAYGFGHGSRCRWTMHHHHRMRRCW